MRNDNKKFIYILIPALIDFIGTYLSFFALVFMNPSIYLMLRAGFIFIVALLSVLILKKKMEINHYIGCILSMGGVIVVGLAHFLFNEN